MKRKEKKAIERLNELRRLAKPLGFGVWAFTPIHCRVFGESTVDYWPSTARAWVRGSSGKAKKLEPAEVISLARQTMPLERLPDGAQEHLHSIA